MQNLVDAPRVQEALVAAWAPIAQIGGQDFAGTKTLPGFFQAAQDVAGQLAEAGLAMPASQIAEHLDYLAAKAGVSRDTLMTGVPRELQELEEQCVLDALANIASAATSAVISGTEPRLQEAFAVAWPLLAEAGQAQRDGAPPLVSFFSAAQAATERLQAAGLAIWADGIFRHLDYLAEKAGLSRAALLAGAPLALDEVYVSDAIHNIASVLRDAVPRLQSEEDTGAVPASVMAAIRAAEGRLQGWCSRQKSLLIAESVIRERPEICVEIGVFGGRSLIPCAAALQHNGSGHVYAIETWQADVAVQDPTNEANDAWWSQVDFSRIKGDLLRFMVDQDLVTRIRVIEAPSARAAALFEQIDFLHIDGSHSMVCAAEDVILYARKLRRGGLVVFDDVNWASTRPAREILTALCDPVTVLTDPETGQELCAVLRKR